MAVKIKALLSLLLFVSIGFADVKITLPESLSGPWGLPIKIMAETEGKVVKWKAPTGVEFVKFPGDTKTVYAFAADPGIYEVFAWTSDQDGPSDLGLTRLTFLPRPAPKPPDPPDPGPGPKPDPVPVTGVKWALFVTSHEEQTIETATILGLKKWRDTLAAKKVNFEIYDTKSEFYNKDPLKLKPYITDVPCVIFMDAKGSVYNKAAIKLPKTEKEMDDLIAKVVGP